MAFAVQYWAEIGFGDSRQDVSPCRIRVTDADAQAWYAAIGFSAKLATQLGVYFLALAGLSDSSTMSYEVQEVWADDAAAFPDPDDNVYNFDKINVGYRAGFDRYTTTIPGRADTNYNVSDDGVTIITTGAGASAQTTAYVAAFNNVVEAKNGSPGVLEKMYVAR